MRFGFIKSSYDREESIEHCNNIMSAESKMTCTTLHCGLYGIYMMTFLYSTSCERNLNTTCMYMSIIRTCQCCTHVLSLCVVTVLAHVTPTACGVLPMTSTIARLALFLPLLMQRGVYPMGE